MSNAPTRAVHPANGCAWCVGADTAGAGTGRALRHAVLTAPDPARVIGLLPEALCKPREAALPAHEDHAPAFKGRAA